MSNPIFNVDRRPVVHIAYSVAGGAADQYWGSSADFVKACVSPSTGLRLSGVTSTTNIGVQQVINTMQYHYDRGIRRFLINTPCGTITQDGSSLADVAYAGLWTPMQQKYQVSRAGVRKINPFPGCWPDGVPSDPYAAGIDSGAITFLSDGRWADWYVLLRTWLGGNAAYGYAPAKPDCEIYVYSSFMIPRNSTGQVNYGTNWIHYPGDSKNYDWLGVNSGFDVPDPANNTLHSDYLHAELGKWYECGICGVGADVGMYGWNHRKGSWIYNTPSFAKTGYANAKTNMREWLTRNYLTRTQGTGSGQRYNQATNFKYFLEIFPWNQDPEQITNRTSGQAFPATGTDEAFALYDPWGSLKTSTNTEFEGSWEHYTAYLCAIDNLTTFKNGAFLNGSDGYNGADPNNKWSFAKDKTEIHLYLPNLASPFTDNASGTLASLSSSISDPATVSIIDDTIDFYMDYMNRGYCYMPLLYHTASLFERTIHKRMMQELGEWPESDPAP